MKKRALANFKHLLSRGSLAHLWLSGKQVAATVHSPLAKRSSSIEYEANKKLWRRGRDSNPRYPFRYGRFRGGSFQPLTHLSAPKASQPLRGGRVSVTPILAAAKPGLIYFPASCYERTHGARVS